MTISPIQSLIRAALMPPNLRLWADDVGWKVFDRQRIPWFRRYGRQVTEAFGPVQRSAVAAVRAGSSARAERIAVEGTRKALEPIYEDLYPRIVTVFGEEAEDNLPKSITLIRARKFDAFKKPIREWIKTQTGKNITNISKETGAGVARIIARGQREKWEIAKVANALEKSYAFSERRAMRIARTEVVAASNAGVNFVGVEKLSPKEFQKDWLDVGDELVRESHDGVDSVELDEPFELDGGALFFPGDTSLGADASEIVNCRCAVGFSRIGD